MEEIPPQTLFAGKRVVLYGPESTGKTTLARQLASHFNTQWVPEFARDFLQKKFDDRGEVAAFEDIVPIAAGQRKLENQKASEAGYYFFSDTCPLETYVYCHYYFQQVPEELERAIARSEYDLYLLMDIDLPWVKDDLRDRPDDRQELFKLFKKALEDRGKVFKIISGMEKTRFAQALDAMKSYV